MGPAPTLRKVRRASSECSHGEHVKCVRGGCQHCGITACVRYVSPWALQHDPASGAERTGVTVREPLSADCRLPLLHRAGCECRRLLEP